MLLDLGKQKEVPVKDLIRELLDFVDDVVLILRQAARQRFE